MRTMDSVRPVFRQHSQLRVHYEAGHGIVWRTLVPEPRPSFTPPLLQALLDCHEDIRNVTHHRWGESLWDTDIRYVVVQSAVPGIFNLGGDLSLFLRLIQEQDREGLLCYATLCVRTVHDNVTNLGLPLTTISLVEGDALGGGCECALSSSVVIAEEGAVFGLPEIMFNLWPGMGAYHLLTRRVGMVEAEKIITSRKVYTAEEFHRMGLVDVLAPAGEGRRALYDYVRQHARRRNALQSLLQVRQEVHPIRYEDLLRTTTLWVDAALRCSDKDLRVMRRLVAAQDRGVEKPGEGEVVQVVAS